MAEKNYKTVAVVPEMPRTIDNQQLHIYTPVGSVSNFGVFKPDGDQFVVVNGVLKADASKLIQLADTPAIVVENGGRTKVTVSFTKPDDKLNRKFQFIFENIKGATGATGATGAKGDTGDNALVYSGSYTETYAGDVMDEPIHLDIAKFSRTPVKGDTFVLVYYTTETEQTTISLFSIYNVYDTYAEAQPVSGTQYVITGPKGEQGIQGEPGTPGKDGDNGVSITSVTQTGVQGGTQVTITLTNGTSSSFIVYNGTADNITNLEFPYGDAAVTYDNTDGLHIHGNCRVTLNGTNYDIPMDVEVPQTAGDGLTEDATADGKKAVIKADETVVRTNKTNQIINGNVTIGGNVTVNGTVTSVSAQNLKVKNKLIVVAEGNTVTLTSPAGLLAPKYDGTNNGALVFDGTGTAYVGDVVLTPDGDIDVAKSDLQPLATRGTLVNGNIVKWNGEKLRLEDTGIAAGDVAKKSDLGKVGNFIYKSNYESATIPTIGQVLTLTNANFSRTPVVGDVFALMEVVNVNDTYYNNMEVLTVGETTCTAKIMSFTDITSCKVTKVTDATPTKQVYAKNADGTQGMVNVGGTADDDIATVGQVNATEPYHITINNLGMTISQEKYNALVADNNSYIVVDGADTYRYNRRTVNGDSEYVYQFVGGRNGTEVVELRPNHMVSLPVTRSQDVAYKKTSIVDGGNNTDYPTTKAVVDYVKANASSAYYIRLNGMNGGNIGETEFNKLSADNGSYILLQIGAYEYKLCRNAESTTDLRYSVVNDAEEYTVIILASDYSWSVQIITLENTANRVTEIKASSADEEYPSAAATYTYGQTVLTNAKAYADSILGAEQEWLVKISTGEGV